MLCFDFEFLMIFDNFDIFQNLIEVNKMDVKTKKKCYISLLIIEF